MVLELKGFMVAMRAPSEENLEFQVDLTNLVGQHYLALIRSLQDLFGRIDEAHAERKTRGRSLKARYQKIELGNGTVVRRRILKFSPYPSRFSNSIKTLRNGAYSLLHKVCLTLQVLQLGYFRRSVFLLPETKTQELFTGIHALNNVIREINQQIRGFNTEQIINLLKEHEVTLIVATPTVPDIAVDLTPIHLSHTVINEWARRDQHVAQLLTAKRKTLIEKAVKSIQEQINNSLERVQHASTAKMRRRILADGKRKLTELKELCHSVGLESVSQEVILPLIEKVEQRSLGSNSHSANQDMFGLAEVNARIRALIDSL